MSTFTQSEHVGELITALAKAQAEFTPAIKDSDNPFFNKKYADLAANLNAVRPALNRNGIAIIQADSSDLSRGAAIVRTSLHCGEQWLAVEAEAPALDKSGNINVQTIGSAWTYLRRYTLQALCGLASEDDDGNSLSGGTGKVTPASVAKPPQNSSAPPDYEPDLPSENTSKSASPQTKTDGPTIHPSASAPTDGQPRPAAIPLCYPRGNHAHLYSAHHHRKEAHGSQDGRESRGNTALHLRLLQRQREDNQRV